MSANHCGISVPGSDIFCNARTKAYPDGSEQVLVCDRAIFGGKGWEDSRPRHVKASRREAGEGGDVERAIRRAKAQVRDLALCTPFRYFVTLTLDAKQVDRYDMAAITRKLNRWCDNQVRRHGLAYVLVPERHKDGAVHFHGFFNGALPVVDSGTLTGGPLARPRKPRSAAERASLVSQGAHAVFNLPGWSLGFTTAIELYGEYSAAVGYVCKYIGKDQGEGGTAGKIGGRWYYSGGDLGHPEVVYHNWDVREVAALPGAYRFDLPRAGMSFAMVTVTPKGGEKHGYDNESGFTCQRKPCGHCDSVLDGAPDPGAVGRDGFAALAGVRGEAGGRRAGETGGPGSAAVRGAQGLI